MNNMTLHLKGMKKSYGGRTVVDIDDLTLGENPIEGLIGPNGAGKTTLMSLITKKINADCGEVLYYPEGKEINLKGKSFDEVARMGLVKTNQIIQDFDSLTIKESLLLSLCSSGYEKFYRLNTDKKLRQEVEEEIQSYFDYFHFEDTEGRALSAGEKKLLDIIRCLVLKPKFLLMDEPTAGLPEDQTKQVMALMKKKTSEEDMVILIVEHDLDLIWNVCECVNFMAEGKLLLRGCPDDIRNNSMVAEKYMGVIHV